MELERVEGKFAVCRLEAGAALPEWAMQKELWSVTATGQEVSVVCRQQFVPRGVRYQGEWSCLRVKGVLDFGLTGVLAELARVLAAAGISIFSVSTYDTDYLLVAEANLEAVMAALRSAGHSVE